VISIVFGYEAFSWVQVVGLLLAIGGNVVQLNVWESGSLGDRYVIGIVEIILNVTSYSIFLVFSKPYLRRLPIPIVYRQMILVGVVGTMILAVVLTDLRAQFRSIPELNGWALSGFLFALLVMAYVPYATVGFALRSGVPSPLIAAHIIYQPVFAAVVGAIALGTVLRWYQYVGGVVAASAVVVTLWMGMRAAVAAQDAPPSHDNDAEMVRIEAPCDISLPQMRT
jgi:drug/metabolite transporter (DMT)-like permease